MIKRHLCVFGARPLGDLLALTGGAEFQALRSHCIDSLGTELDLLRIIFMLCDWKIGSNCQVVLSQEMKSNTLSVSEVIHHSSILVCIIIVRPVDR